MVQPIVMAAVQLPAGKEVALRAVLSSPSTGRKSSLHEAIRPIVYAVRARQSSHPLIRLQCLQHPWLANLSTGIAKSGKTELNSTCNNKGLGWRYCAGVIGCYWMWVLALLLCAHTCIQYALTFLMLGYSSVNTMCWRNKDGYTPGVLNGYVMCCFVVMLKQQIPVIRQLNGTMVLLYSPYKQVLALFGAFLFLLPNLML